MKTNKIPSWILAITACVAVQVQAQSFLTNGLVAYYPFSGNSKDASGFGNDLTNYGATPCPDRFGTANRAFHFDGLSSYMLSTSPSSPLPSGAADRTLSLWVKADSVVTNGGTFVAIDYGDSQNTYNAVFGCFLQPDWGVHFDGPNQAVFSGVSPDASWHQLVCVYSSGNVQMFIDGVEYANTPKATFTGIGELIVGQVIDNGYSEYFPGVIDDIRIYNRAFSSNEVAQLYTIESTTPPVITLPSLNLTIRLELFKQGDSNTNSLVLTTASPISVLH